jgi:hypothetical protein
MIDEEVSGLLSPSIRTAKFDTVGRVYKGTVLAARARQVTDMQTGQPQFWPNGDPRKEVLIDLQTDERDSEDDDGVRRVYVKGGMVAAVREALAAAKVKSLEVGGKLSIKYTGDGEATQRGFNPPKLYAAKYEPPAPQALSEEDF